MEPEEKARQKIDQLLTAARWVVQSRNTINLGAGVGVAVREYALKSGYADYLLSEGRSLKEFLQTSFMGV